MKPEKDFAERLIWLFPIWGWTWGRGEAECSDRLSFHSARPVHIYLPKDEQNIKLFTHI